MTTILTGGCHCGAVSLRFATEKPLDQLPLLACQCGFCRKHGTRAIADPTGALTITLSAPRALTRYVFGLKTADYLLCRHCGIYLGAVCASLAGERALLNINCLSDAARFTAPPRPVDYDGETRAARLMRRQQGWTPVSWAAG